MAKLDSKEDGQVKVTCDSPRCLVRRQERGQKNGRYILTLSKIPADDLTITVLCPECGANHTMTFSKPVAQSA
jgi:hypothetical protein